MTGKLHVDLVCGQKLMYFLVILLTNCTYNETVILTKAWGARKQK